MPCRLGRRAASALTGAAALCLARCAETPLPPGSAEAPTLVVTTYGALPGWADDHLARALAPLQRECRRFATLHSAEPLGGTGLAATTAGTPERWQPACAAALAISATDEIAARTLFQTWFAPYRIAVSVPATATGYFEPEVAGATSASPAFPVPVLARPVDLATQRDPDGTLHRGRVVAGRLTPYPSRAAIEQGELGELARPLLWLRSRTDLLTLQIQGSGRVRLPDGAVLHLGYDGQNGAPYTPIGRVLVEQGALAPDAVDLPAIRAWLDAHPAQADAVIDRNEAYVFFRILPMNGEPGPPGALGVPLTPGRSAAIDRAVLPLGVPVWLDTTDPLTGTGLRRLVLAQDLGTDIKGAGRLDLFLGAGDLASQAAGRLHAAASLVVLLPRP